MRHANAEQREDIDQRLTAPLPGERGRAAKATPFTEEEEGQMFMSAMQQLTGG